MLEGRALRQTAQLPPPQLSAGPRLASGGGAAREELLRAPVAPTAAPPINARWEPANTLPSPGSPGARRRPDNGTPAAHEPPQQPPPSSAAPGLAPTASPGPAKAADAAARVSAPADAPDLPPLLLLPPPPPPPGPTRAGGFMELLQGDVGDVTADAGGFGPAIASPGPQPALPRAARLSLPVAEAGWDPMPNPAPPLREGGAAREAAAGLGAEGASGEAGSGASAPTNEPAPNLSPQLGPGMGLVALETDAPPPPPPQPAWQTL